MVGGIGDDVVCVYAMQPRPDMMWFGSARSTMAIVARAGRATQPARPAGDLCRCLLYLSDLWNCGRVWGLRRIAAGLSRVRKGGVCAHTVDTETGRRAQISCAERFFGTTANLETGNDMPGEAVVSMS